MAESHDIDADAPIFAIAVAAELSGMHPQTLRQYDRLGLVVPARTQGGSRRYSLRHVEQLREVARMSADGIGPARHRPHPRARGPRAAAARAGARPRGPHARRARAPSRRPRLRRRLHRQRRDASPRHARATGDRDRRVAASNAVAPRIREPRAADGRLRRRPLLRDSRASADDGEHRPHANMQVMDTATLDELRALRARAYGPSADIDQDPAAVRRLHELEAGRKPLGSPDAERARRARQTSRSRPRSPRAPASSVTGGTSAGTRNAG